MTVYTPIKKQETSRVPNSSYIRTENKPDEAAQPEKAADPAQPEAK